VRAIRWKHRGRHALAGAFVGLSIALVGMSFGARVAGAQTADTTVAPDSVQPGGIPNGICISCKGTPPTVTITPGTSTFGSASQSVTIDWCDDSSLAATTRSITLNGTNVTSQFTYVTVAPPTCGGGSEAKSVGTVTLRSGANTFIAQIKDGSAQLGADTVTYTFTQLVTVTPDSAPLTGYAKLADTAAFTVKNTTSGSLTYTLTTACPTGWGCAVSPASLTLNGGASSQVNVTYSPQTSGTSGTLTLTATPTSSPSSADQGSYKVTVPVTVGVTAAASQVNAYWGVSGSVLFTVANSAPAQETFTLTQQCTGPGVTSCTVSPSATVAANSSAFVTVNYTPGDSNQTATVKLTATGSDGGNVSSASVFLTVKGSEVTCDTTSFNCLDKGDRTPPVIAVRPGSLTRNVRTDTLVIDWCDNGKFDGTQPLLAVNGNEVTPALLDSLGNTAFTCTGAAARHSPAVLTLLPGGNTLSAFRCDAAGNCTTTDAIYTYTVLNVTTADSALLRRGAGSTFNQAFRVTNIGHEPYVFSLAGSCTGAGVTACAIVGATADTLNPGASQVDTVSYQTPSTAAGQTGTVSLLVSPVVNPAWSDSGSVTVHTITAVVAAAATPDSISVPVASSVANTYPFWVRNAGNVRESFTLTLGCTGVTVCSTTPTSATLAPGDSARTQATFTAGVIGSAGSVQLSATTGSVTDHATILVHAQAKNQPVASLDSTFAAGRIERSLCVTVAVGTGGTADECGDLRLAVANSAVRTLGETRAPTLLYGSSDATAAVVVPVWVSFLSQATVPDSVTATLLVGGVIYDHGAWPKAQWAAGAGRQIALAVDGRTLSGGPGGANDHSGVYAATIQITSFTGSTTLADTLSTAIPVVDRSQSPFGAGWWLAGLERLYFPSDGTLTWVGGDGSLRTYTKDPAHTSIYRATSLTRLDSLVKDAGGQFIRYLPNRLHVRFNTAGQHIATITRLGDSTVFTYNGSGQLSAITVAPISAGKTYSFFYDASGRLDSVAAPLGGANGTTRRTTKVTAIGTTRQVGSLTLADGSLMQLTYDPAHAGRVLTTTDPRGTTTAFVYDSAGKVATTTIGMKGVVPDLVTKITASVSQGMHGTAAVDTAVVATRIDDPRTDVGDTTVIRITPFGAPRRITDALGHITRLDYSNTSFPALVTHEHRLDAAASIATYDAKGHLTATTDSTTYVDDAVGTRTFATTTYRWDGVWDEVDTIAPPLHDSTVMTYDATTGNRLTQRDVVGDTVHFGYNTGGRLVSVRRATHAAPDSLTYDALVNVASTITPLGYVTTNFRDAIGRDTLVKSPIDTGQKLFASNRMVYDIADRITLSQSYGPADTFALPSHQIGTSLPETLTVATVYDSAGLVRRVTRTARPDRANVGSLVTRMGYDPAGRKVADTATDGAADAYHYDADGHVIEHDTRNGMVVTWQYDALGELSARQMTAGTTPGTITFDTMFVAWAPSDFAQHAGESATFRYDSAGRLLAADNAAAEVRRAYAPNGELLTDSILIDTWAETGDYSRHDYVLTHTYDLDARRVATRGVGGDSAAYDLAGRVSGIQDAGGQWFRYHYDALGRPDTVTDPDGARLIHTFDVQDQLRRRQELGPAPKDSIFHDDTLTYDARGKVLTAFGVTETDYEGYSALGTLWASMRDNTAIGPALQNDETFTADAMGNVALHKANRSTGGAPVLDTIVTTYGGGTGRLLATHGLVTADTTIYTAAGDRAILSGRTGTTGANAARYYYRADGLLVAVDNRSCTNPVSGKCIPQGVLTPNLRGAFEDYRYDALGRRVEVRTRKDQVCTGQDCEGSLMWVVFDGSAIAAEMRGDGADGISADSLEKGPGQGAYYGTVDYLNGPQMDDPLEIQGIEVHRTWRGLIDGGACLTGQCGTGTIDYPGITYEAYLSVVPSMQSVPQSWHGSLFAEGQDDGGLMYRRNRYYDPATGQFTQEDPLGLAGGTNAYGFAGGDPVNEVDPFGTDCPPGKVVLVCVLIQVFSKFGVPVAPFVHKEPIVVRNPSAPTLPKPLETPELPDWGDIGSESAEAKTRLNPRIGGGGGKGPSEADPSETLREMIKVGSRAGGGTDAAGGSASLATLGAAGALAGVAILIPFKKLGGHCSAEARSHGCMDQ